MLGSTGTASLAHCLPSETCGFVPGFGWAPGGLEPSTLFLALNLLPCSGVAGGLGDHLGHPLLVLLGVWGRSGVHHCWSRASLRASCPPHHAGPFLSSRNQPVGSRPCFSGRGVCPPRQPLSSHSQPLLCALPTSRGAALSARVGLGLSSGLLGRVLGTRGPEKHRNVAVGMFGQAGGTMWAA